MSAIPIASAAGTHLEFLARDQGLQPAGFGEHRRRWLFLLLRYRLRAVARGSQLQTSSHAILIWVAFLWKKAVDCRNQFRADLGFLYKITVKECDLRSLLRRVMAAD